jgi:transglutaminase-like putative cysteine protease
MVDMRYEVVHRTRYEYDAPVTASYAQVHQLPWDVDGQRCLRRSITATPLPEFRRERVDYFGNPAAFLSIDQTHDELIVTSTCLVDTSGRPTGFGPAADAPWERFSGNGASRVDLVAVDFSLDSPLVSATPRLAEMAYQAFTPGRPLAEATTHLCSLVHESFRFKPGSTDVTTTIDEVLDLGEGVCQDFAHVMIGCLRSVGVPAGYVSGYLETEPPPGKERLTGVDRTHAWVSVYLGDGRWVGIDPTNDQMAGPRYVTAARGRDYSDVPPLKGVIYTDAEESTLTVEVDVVPA